MKKKRLGKKKENDGNYEYVGTAKITLTPSHKLSIKNPVSVNYETISYDSSQNPVIVTRSTVTEKIKEGEDIPKTNDRNIKTEKKLPFQVEAKKGKPKTGKLSKGKGFKIPKEKFIGTLRETYDCCKKEEAEKGEKWTGTKMAKYAMKLLESRYGDKYDADFKQRYLENKFSEIKQRKL